jgi:hypothetical protein
LIVLALAIARPAAGQQLEGTTRPEILSRQSRPFCDPGAGSGRAGYGPLNPLDSPDARYVWNPFTPDAGTLGDDRWMAYAAHRREASVPAVAEPQSPKPARWIDYPHYDSVAEFFQSVFR